MHLLDVDGVDEVDAVMPAQNREDAFAHDRAQVDGVDDLHVGMRLHDAQDGVHDVLHGLAVVLPPVAGDGDDAAATEIQLVEQLRREDEIRLHGVAHGVDGRVAGDEDVAHDGLAAQILRVRAGGRKMQIGDVADERAVHLLREGGVFVPGAKPCFHMADLHLMVKRGQRPGKRRGRIAVDEHEVGLDGVQHLVHAEQGLGGDGGECLALFHDVQVIIARQAEYLHDGIEHFPVLAGEADDAFDLLAGLQRLDERRHLDGLRPRAEDGHDFQLIHAVPPVFLPAPAKRRPRQGRSSRRSA